jgi:hypothetical protein
MIRRLRPRTSRRLIAIVLVGVALGASACVASPYSFYGHHNGDNTELYFKLPSSWKTYDSSQVIESVNGKLSPSQLQTIEGGEWLLYFAASHKVALSAVGETGSNVPEGEAFARQLDSSDADALSLAALRSEFLGADPLDPSAGPFQDVTYTQFVWPGGIHGSKLTVNITEKKLVTTFSQVVAVDPQTSWIYGIGIGCRASCYGPNSGLINQVINSWTVKELAR